MTTVQIVDPKTGQTLVKVSGRKKKKPENIDGPDAPPEQEAEQTGTRRKKRNGEMVEAPPTKKALTDAESESLRTKATEFCGMLEESTLELAGILYSVFDTVAYLDWTGAIYNEDGDEIETRQFASWREYVDNELNIGVRKADYLVSIWRWYTIEMDDPKLQGRIRKIGWTKLKELVDVCKKDNAEEWLDKAEGMTCAQLAADVRACLKGQKPDDAEQITRRSFTLVDEQAEIVDQALEHAGTVADSDKPGHRLTLICQDYMAGAVRPTSKSKKAAYLRQMEKMLNVKLVAVDPESKAVIHGTDTLKFLDSKTPVADEDDSGDDAEELDDGTGD